MRDDWDNLRTVLHVVRLGSIAAAARALEVNTTTITRRIGSAEEGLGTRLFDRTPLGYVPTDAGREAAVHAEAMESHEFTLRRTLAGRDAALSGPMTITAPQLLIATHLCHVIDQFLELHPLIDLTVLSTNDVLDLANREADLAIRISDNPGDDLIGRRLTGQQTASFATPALARALEEDPSMRIDWIGFTFWDGPPKASLAAWPNARVKLRFDDMTAVVGAAQAGLGVARMAMFLGRATPGLVQVPLLPPQKYQDIWVLTHRDLKDAAKIRAFKDLLVSWFKSHAGDFSTAG
jgi:DNA-binding transcriptional LysR family regulator